ncbi:uncharacterized protein C19orf44 homolog [Austrofundulus limnaeus]|uniref:Uncharacterized protein C19orf44 homolog n=1 Tax=Austrofundulus limnaeus TaxID=52670 RepID=A0A2I4BYR6_AUSLI|nr:PREDICTED: uncharacterized protein C19orf44 homolog [Austrofundulus limnaeus]
MESSQGIGSQSSLGGGSRFLKKAPKPAKSSQSPVSRIQTRQRPEPSGVSQAAARSRLSEIEKRVNSRRQAIGDTRQAAKSAPDLTWDWRALVTAVDAVRPAEASEQLLAHSSSEQSQKIRFLKNQAAGSAAAVDPIIPDGSGRIRTRTTDPVGLKLKPAAVTRGVSLDSDEEDMKKLLGDSMDSTDNSSSGPKKTSSVKRLNKEQNRPSPRVQSPAPPQAGPSSSPPSTPPPPHRSSPFRFTDQAQVHFSPSVLSAPPSPPSVSPSHSERVGLPHGAGAPREVLLSLSEQGEVFSLEELVPVRPEDQHSPTGSVSSEDFKTNLMTIDELLPVPAGFTMETLGNKLSQRQSKHVHLVSGTQHVHQQQEQEQDYQSDFESDSSIRPVSEQVQEEADENEVPSEAPASVGSHQRTGDDYSPTFSERSCSSTSQTSDHSQRSTSASPDSQSSHPPRRSRTLTRKALKEAATQTQPAALAGSQSFGVDLALSRLYMNTPVVTHTISAERLEAISSFSPVVFALNEMLKQQLNMTRHFINHRDHLHSCLLRGLDPPNYRYTRLEDTIQPTKPNSKVSKNDDDFCDSLFENEKLQSKTTHRGPLNRLSTTDKVYSVLAEEAMKDGLGHYLHQH